MMYIDNEVLEKMIMTIVEGFDRIEKKLDRMERVKEFLNGDELLDNYDIARLIMVPVFGLFLGRRGSTRLWLSMVIAVGGLYLLCMKNGFGGIETSDWILLSCAVLFSFQIITVDHFAPQVDGVRLSLLQFFVVAVESTIAALLFENPTLAEFGANWLPLAYCGVMSSGVAYTLQILGQRGRKPRHCKPHHRQCGHQGVCRMSPRYERRQRGGGGALLLLIAAAALVVAVLAIFTDVFSGKKAPDKDTDSPAVTQPADGEPDGTGDADNTAKDPEGDQKGGQSGNTDKPTVPTTKPAASNVITTDATPYQQ